MKSILTHVIKIGRMLRHFTPPCPPRGLGGNRNANLLRMAPRTRRFDIWCIVTGHARFKIELCRFAVCAAVRCDKAGAEVVGGQHIHVTVAVNTEAALLVTGSATEVA